MCVFAQYGTFLKPSLLFRSTLKVSEWVHLSSRTNQIVRKAQTISFFLNLFQWPHTYWLLSPFGDIWMTLYLHPSQSHHAFLSTWNVNDHIHRDWSPKFATEKNGRFPTISSQSCTIYINVFLKTEIGVCFIPLESVQHLKMTIYIYVDRENLARNGRKTANCESQILVTSLNEILGLHIYDQAKIRLDSRRIMRPKEIGKPIWMD